ncbi:MAG TPA: ABC transporter permease, partial [Thermoanaerobaculia bacterium]|nr:ABC transporter permease [Thermoanaerobaculia bacterium]
MRTLRFLLQKEFLQIFRDRQILPMIFLMPILQLIVLASAATFEVKSAKVDLLDQDHSPTSRRLVEHFAATGYFRITGRPASLAEAERDLELSRARMILNIPPHFEEDLRRNRRARLLLLLVAGTAGCT